jgi:hypothetical protein
MNVAAPPPYRGLAPLTGLIREWSLAGQAVAPGGALAEPGSWGAGSGGGWLQGDGVAEGFELCDQAACFPLGIQAAGEVAGAELLVGPAGGQDVPDDECDTRSHMLRVNLADWRASMS